MLISAGSIISSSVKLYRDNFQLFLRYIGILFILAAITSIMAPFTYGSALMGLIYFIVTVVAGVASIWVSIAFVRALAARYQSKKVGDIKTELQSVTKMILPVILVAILTGLAVLGGLILLIIPGIIFAVWFAFSYYTLILDDKRGVEALKTSKKLVEGRWFGIFWRLIAPGIVFTLLAFILQAVVTLPLGDLKYTDLGLVVMGLLGSAAALIVTPLSTAAPTILYLELKKAAPSSDAPKPIAK